MPKPFDLLRKTGLTAALTLLLAGAIRAADWPQWRGPNRDGVWAETGVLKSFPAEGLKVCWRAPVGPGWSSPVVAQGRVYVTDSQLVRPKAKERVLCFAEATGKPLWTFSYDVSYPDWAFTGEPGRGPTATPIVQAGRLYTLGNKGDLFCFDAPKGKPLWKRNLEKEYQVQEFAFNASPLIEGNLLILCIGSYPGTPASYVVALDKGSGKEVWKTPTEGLTNSSPISITAGGKRQVIVWTQGSVTSLDPATGKRYWRERMNTSAASAVATPVFHKNLLLVSGLMLKLDSRKPAASVLWPATKSISRRILSNTSTALIQGDHLFSAKSSGELVCLEASTGKQVWETDKVTGLTGGASIHLTPNGDGVFLHTDKGELIRAQLTAKGYKEISRTVLLKPVAKMKAWPPPAYAKCHVFARNDEQLICASLAGGDTPKDQPATFKITTRRKDDSVAVLANKRRTVFAVKSPFGISQAVIKRQDNAWPKVVVLRLHLKGLSSFRAANGKVQLDAAVSIEEGKTKVRLWKDGKEDAPLDDKSPCWMDIHVLGGDGKPAKELPLKDGYFEMTLPRAFFEGNPESITLNWIDFYRG